MVHLCGSDVSPPAQPVYIAGMNDKPKPLTDAARRALAEAEARRAAAEATPKSERPAEHQGPKGLEPTRFGDWERKGIVSDF